MGIPGLAGTRRTPAPTSRSGQSLTGPPSGGRKAVKPEFQETDGGRHWLHPPPFIEVFPPAAANYKHHQRRKTPS